MSDATSPIVNGAAEKSSARDDRQRSEEALRRSEQRYRALVEASDQVVWSWTPKEFVGDFDWTQEWWGELTGQSVEEQRGSHVAWLNVVHPDDRETAGAAWGSSLATGTTYDVEYRVRARTGGWRHIKARGIPIPGLDGTTQEWVGTLVDVTERRQAEDARRQSEEWFRGLVTATSDVVYRMSPDWAEMRHLDGRAFIADTAAPSHSWLDTYIPSDERGRVTAAIEVAVRDKQKFELEHRVLRADGTVGWTFSRAIPILDRHGAIVEWFGAASDVTERKRSEVALRESEDRRRLALDAAELGSWHVDPAGMALTTDERFRAIFGVADGELCYEAAVARIHPDDQERVRDAVAAAIRPDDPVPYGIEYRVALPDGGVRWVFAKGRPNFAGAGSDRRMVSFDGTLADITEQKRVGDSLRQLAADLSDADRRKDEFLATLAHELRNLLAPIRNGLQVLTLSDKPDVRERAVAMMGRQLGQMVRLVDDLMDVSRVSRGKMELKREWVPLAAVLASAVETSRPLIDQMGHELTYTPPARDVVVDADLTRLAQAFLNLLNNAAKYMDRGGRIWLSAEQRGNGVEVSVRDAGVGIAADQLPCIFDLFSQVDRSLEKAQGGLGIGLTLVRRLTEMHGGTIDVRSDGPGKGSEFVVRLPVIEAVVPAEAQREERLALAARRILIVDDNRDGADSLAEMMAIFGNDTRTAYDGEAAVAVAAEFQPEVILLDIGLPKINGYEACRRIRAQKHGTRPLIIAQTGWGADEDRQRTREAGFDHHLVKPVDPSALMKLLADTPA